jgi:signal transduction histidine kinase
MYLGGSGMKGILSSFLERPGLIATTVGVFVVVVWSICLYSILSQLGKPFPGFFFTPDNIINGFTPRDFSGWEAGLRPWDRILLVNGQHWRELPRLVNEAGVGSTLVYTVQRGEYTLDIPVTTMEFSGEIVFRYLPGSLLLGLLLLSVAIFVYIRNPRGGLNHYSLFYLSAFACAVIVGWEYYLSPLKWTAYFHQPLGVFTTIAGWIFFWNFPADRERKRFLAKWPLVKTFIILGLTMALGFPLFFFLASRFDTPILWQYFTLTFSWGAFLLLGGGSLFNKTFPLIQIISKKDVSPLIRLQARVLLAGIGLGLCGFIVFMWLPGYIHYPPPGNPQWGALIATIYPLSVGYAVLRYHLFDISVVIRKGLVYSLLTATLTAVFLLLSLVSGYLFQLLTGHQSILVALFPALLIAFMFQPVRVYIQSMVDRAFYRREYEMRRTLQSFNQGLNALRERNEVVDLVLNTVSETLGVEKAALLLLNPDKYTARGDGFLLFEPEVENLFRWLEKEKRPLLGMPDDQSPVFMSMRRVDAALAVPITVGKELIGILFLGEKRSGDLFTQDDLELLTTLAQSTGLALENARLHEERIAYLRQQLAQMTAVQEAERQRIARELHDGLGPALASLNVRLQTTRKSLEREQHPAAQEIQELAELAQVNIKDIRQLIYDLRPLALDELGLLPALREYLHNYQQENGFQVNLFVNQDETILSPEMETTIFRLIQEALTNIARHADAQRVDISIKCDPHHLRVEIGDNGKGFDLKEASRRAQKGGHLGLWSMRERVEQLGGRIQIDSQLTKGTRIQVELALRGNVASKDFEVL